RGRGVARRGDRDHGVARDRALLRAERGRGRRPRPRLTRAGFGRMLAAMGQATGRADLPLHGGRVPAWLATRMATLGRIITEAIVLHEGRDGFLRRLSHPFWFQAFGAVMGMDWHSSGITTSVMGALKRGLAPVSHDLGIHVCGGRGRHARKTPEELANLGMRTGLDADGLTHASRLV